MNRKPRLHDAIHDYLRYVQSLGRSAATVKGYRDRLMGFAKATKTRCVSDLSVSVVNGYHDGLIRRDLADTTRHAYLVTLGGFLQWAHERGMTMTNLADRIEQPKPRRKLPPQPLTVDEVYRLIGLIEGRSVMSKRNRAMLELLYACGLRRNELVNLNVGDINATDQTVFVRGGKGDKDRIVPIHERALEAIAIYLESRRERSGKTSPLFVTHDGKPTRRINNCVVDYLFARLRKRFNKHVHPHLLRHTFACHLVEGGADVRIVQVLMGHESPSATARYLGLIDNDLRDSYDRGIEVILSG